MFGIQNILSSICYVNQKNLAACLLSLDFFKAYDRVIISFLLRVMKRMGFSPTFCKWIAMLHEGAQAKFLLSRVSRAISIASDHSVYYLCRTITAFSSKEGFWVMHVKFSSKY